MKIFTSAEPGDSAGVAETAKEYDRIGVQGVVVGDHLFLARSRGPAYPHPDPFTLLAAYGMASPTLTLSVFMANVQLSHPALICRSALQLAELFGPERVLMGLGGGWQDEELRAIGQTPLGGPEKLDALQEAASIFRQIVDDGSATLHGRYISANNLPRSRPVSGSLRLAVGGASTKFLRAAGIYADHVDLDWGAESARALPGGSYEANLRRKMATSCEELAASIGLVKGAARAAHRPAPEFSVHLSHLALSDRPVEEPGVLSLAARTGLPPQTVLDSAYVVVGDAQSIRDRLKRLTDVGVGVAVVRPTHLPALVHVDGI